MSSSWFHLLKILLCFFVACFSVCSSASPVDRRNKVEHRDYSDWEQSLIDHNIAISKWLDGAAESLDLFLAGERLTDKRNDTQVVIETSAFYSEREGFNDATSFGINLRLPNVEEYWQLTFTSYDETRERGVRNSYLRQTGREQDFGASVGFFKRLGNVRTAFRPRVSFSGAPRISHSLSFESVAEKTFYRINPKLEFYADAGRGTGIFQAVNFNFQLNDVLSLTLINEGDYEDRSHIYSVSNGLSLGQWVDSRSSIAYGVLFNSKNQPNYQLAEYIFSVGWTHIIYKNILDFELIPYLSFSRDFNYVGNYGLILNNNIRF